MKSYLAILCLAALILSPATNANVVLGNIGNDVSNFDNGIKESIGIIKDLLSGSETKVEEAIDQAVAQNTNKLNQITNQAVQNINQTTSDIIANIDQAAAQSGESVSQIGQIASQGGQKIGAIANQAGLDISNAITMAGKEIGLIKTIFCYKANTSDCQALAQKAAEATQTLGQQAVTAVSELGAAAANAGLAIGLEVENVAEGIAYGGHNTNVLSDRMASRGVSADDYLKALREVAQIAACRVLNALTGIDCDNVGGNDIKV